MFTDNPDFYGGHVRGQEPIWAFQAHAGYNFGPNFWISADANYYLGGRTSVDGEVGDNYQSVLRYGATASAPLGHGFSLKAAWGSWLTARNNGRFNTASLTLQYRWFDQ
ncbi:transporter [Rhodoblastus sp.]|uniref:transporter n=1 Tax=Rhodoblastus sp. TaxID=1962975 RepID=UPI0035AF7248